MQALKGDASPWGIQANRDVREYLLLRGIQPHTTLTCIHHPMYPVMRVLLSVSPWGPSRHSIGGVFGSVDGCYPALR